MQILKKGKFFGISKKEYSINGMTIAHSSYHHFSNCPWHYHNNAHFAFTTGGTLTETHKAQKINLYAGCLMYNHSQEPHHNSNYSENVSALHVDIPDTWFAGHEINSSNIEGVHLLQNPLLKEIFFKVFQEVNIYDSTSHIAIENLIIDAIAKMRFYQSIQERSKPLWVEQIRDLLHANCCGNLTLTSVAKEINIHPVYLCQQFPQFFNCSFGEYIRKLRIERAVQYILDRKDMSLTEIAYLCGFSDQSHFIRTFKSNVGTTPLNFKKYLS